MPPPLSLSHEPKKIIKLMTVLLFFVTLYLIFEDCLYLTIFIFCDLENKFISGDKTCRLI